MCLFSYSEMLEIFYIKFFFGFYALLHFITEVKSLDISFVNVVTQFF